MRSPKIHSLTSLSLFDYQYVYSVRYTFTFNMIIFSKSYFVLQVLLLLSCRIDQYFCTYSMYRPHILLEFKGIQDHYTDRSTTNVIFSLVCIYCKQAFHTDLVKYLQLEAYQIGKTRKICFSITLRPFLMLHTKWTHFFTRCDAI